MMRKLNTEGAVVMTRRQALPLMTVGPLAACASAPRPMAAPIDWQGFVPIGGVEQWVTTRGRARTALLFLHGGPGEAQSPFLPVFAPWEERHVVAQWDQRGSGRSFEKSGGLATPNMTFEQHVRDAIDVTQLVLRRMGISKLILVGHSWGSMVGLMAARSRPELFHAFIGTGQVVSGRETIEGMRISALERAREANNAQAVAQLSGLTASDLGDLAKLDIVFRWQAPFVGADKAYLGMQADALAGRAGAPAVMTSADYYRARLFCVGKLMPSVLEYDARAAGLDLQVPFFVIQGQGDNRTPPEAARALVDQARAPAKNYTAIEGGHFACFTNPSAFLDALDSDLRKAGIHAA
jgi:pimeloyl-ACP methyl ester carboxylesterase